jgi:sulfur relay (sulfurtransferase) DsrF/TusC family protein
MAQKKVVITFNQAPFGTIHYVEGLRASVGVTSGLDEHKIDVIYLGDGARYALKGVDRSDANKYLSTLSKLGYKLKVERESLAENGISESEVADDFQVIPRGEVVRLIADADVTIDF